MVKRLLSFIILILTFLNLPLMLSAQEDSKPFTIQDVGFTSELTRENQILFSKTFGVTFQLNNLSNEPVVIKVPLVGRDSEFMRGSIKVSEDISGQKFVETYKLVKPNCDRQFIFEDSTNDIVMCIRPMTQMRIKVDGTILGKYNLSQTEICSPKVINFTLDNSFTVELPHTSHPYFFSAKNTVAEGIDVGPINGTVCQFSDATLPITVNRLNNGFYCQGVIPPTPWTKRRMVTLKLGGWDREAREKEESREFAKLQEKYINASAEASVATISTKNVPWISLGVAAVNLLATLLLVCATFILARVTANQARSAKETLEETRRAAAGRVALDIIPDDTTADVRIPYLRITNVGGRAIAQVSIKGKIHLKNQDEHSKKDVKRLKLEELDIDEPLQFLGSNKTKRFQIQRKDGSFFDYHSLLKYYSGAKLIVRYRDIDEQEMKQKDWPIDFSILK